jgi:hypothetical protein
VNKYLTTCPFFLFAVKRLHVVEVQFLWQIDSSLVDAESPRQKTPEYRGLQGLLF